MSAFYRVRLFLKLVWREWEPKGGGIPEKFRIKHRLTVRESWDIAKGVWQ